MGQRLGGPCKKRNKVVDEDRQQSFLHAGLYAPRGSVLVLDNRNPRAPTLTDAYVPDPDFNGDDPAFVPAHLPLIKA